MRSQAHERLGRPDQARADRLGQTVQARTSLDRAVRWLREQTQRPDRDVHELASFRAEAEAVLAVPRDDLPDDVFADPR
jgi:hypothetical protein